MAVGDVVELVGEDRAVGFGFGQFLGQTACVTDVVVGVLEGGRWDLDQLRARKTDHVFLFLRLSFRKDDHGFEAHRRAHKREANTGVACCAFDNRAAGLEFAAGDGVADDEKRGAVLDRLTGVQKLGLAVDLTPRFLAGAAEFDQRGFSDCVGEILGNTHGQRPFLNV